jgi:hypothetical protein
MHGQKQAATLKKKKNKVQKNEDRTSPSDPRMVTRNITVTLPFSANITSRISPLHPAKKD